MFLRIFTSVRVKKASCFFSRSSLLTAPLLLSKLALPETSMNTEQKENKSKRMTHIFNTRSYSVSVITIIIATDLTRFYKHISSLIIKKSDCSD